MKFYGKKTFIRTMHKILQKSVCIVLFPLLLLLNSCSGYRTLPLTPSVMDEKLKTPDWGSVLIEAQKIKHPIIRPILICENEGFSPDTAAVVAVLLNHSLRAIRDKKGIAEAQLLQAGILPNPQLSYSLEVPYKGITLGTVKGYSYGFVWNPFSLLTRKDVILAAKQEAKSVNLDIAWQEWQIAEKAKLLTYHMVVINRKLAVSKSGEEELGKSKDALKQAVDNGDETIIGLSAAEVAWRTAHLFSISIEQQLEDERLQLNELLGVPSDQQIQLDLTTKIPEIDEQHFCTENIFSSLEERRLDLLALKIGYKSQESKVRIAVINQFPAINLGPFKTRDNSAVYSNGYSIAFDLPIFDRNQGKIALEKATRKQLYDEYISRVFTARSDVARSLANLKALKNQIESAKATLEVLHELNNVYHQALLEGNADVVTYYNSKNTYILKELEMHDLQLKFIDQYIALEIASGQYLEKR